VKVKEYRSIISGEAQTFYPLKAMSAKDRAPENATADVAVASKRSLGRIESGGRSMAQSVSVRMPRQFGSARYFLKKNDPAT